jgi:hypothetical protein
MSILHAYKIAQLLITDLLTIQIQDYAEIAVPIAKVVLIQQGAALLLAQIMATV